MEKLNTNWMMINIESGEMKELPTKFNANKIPHSYLLTFYGNLRKQNFRPTLGQLVILGEMDNNNALFFPKEMLTKISQYYDIPIDTLRTDVKRLISNDIIIKIAQNVYFVDPHLFTKTSKERVEQLRNNWNKISLAHFKEKTKKEIAKIKDENLINKVNGILNES